MLPFSARVIFLCELESSARGPATCRSVPTNPTEIFIHGAEQPSARARPRGAPQTASERLCSRRSSRYCRCQNSPGAARAERTDDSRNSPQRGHKANFLQHHIAIWVGENFFLDAISSAEFGIYQFGKLERPARSAKFQICNAVFLRRKSLCRR